MARDLYDSLSQGPGVLLIESAVGYPPSASARRLDAHTLPRFDLEAADRSEFLFLIALEKDLPAGHPILTSLTTARRPVAPLREERDRHCFQKLELADEPIATPPMSVPSGSGSQ